MAHLSALNQGSIELLSALEKTRLRISKSTDAEKKSKLGQFMTPARTAEFMAALFPKSEIPFCRLLDPGAGIGSLCSAFLERWSSGGFNFSAVNITACEFDSHLRKELMRTLFSYSERADVFFEVIEGDFIEEAVNRIQFGIGTGYTHAILNPPYKKISSDSRHRLLLRQVGIETVNLYSAFVALALELMADGGHLVAIIPRSFCNGPYYRAFREFMLKRAALRHIHLFASRDKAFRDDGVLQENVILLLEREGEQSDVMVTASTDDSFADLSSHAYSFNRIVLPEDPERVINIPNGSERNRVELSQATNYSLEDVGAQISTGPVVDFRVKKHIRSMPEPGTVPLLYPCHFSGQTIKWPKPNAKKPNAILYNSETEKWLLPIGYYCVVRRFSSKEEKRRIVAGVVEPSVFGDAKMLGFENHLNVFHLNKGGLPEALAHGLAIFLNTTAVDEHFRRFSGHTQVNAADLRRIKYPSREALIALGQWAMHNGRLTQEICDKQVEKLIA